MDIRSFFSKTPPQKVKTPPQIQEPVKRKHVDTSLSQKTPSPKKLRTKKTSPESTAATEQTQVRKLPEEPEGEPLKQVPKQSAPSSIPKGAPDTLTGISFALTGDLPSIDRESAEDLIKRCGGTISDKVSGKTKYLVAGTTTKSGQEVTTTSKYRDAVEKQTRIIDEKELFNVVSQAVMKREQTLKQHPASPSKKVLGKRPMQEPEGVIWTEKHKPNSTSQLLGNAGIAKNLKSWLLNWHKTHVLSKSKPRFNPKLSENSGAKMALLSGPPGIGKTSLATLISKECGFEVTEFNASDVRSKKCLQSGGLRDIVQNTTLSFGATDHTLKAKKRVVIMDEVDGMSSGDRGGITELISIIKSSKTPIICICNDRQSTKIRSLANYSYDLRFRRPTKQQICSRFVAIGKEEGMKIEPNALMEVIEKFGNDVRQVLNFMQMWKQTSTTMTYDDIKKQFFQMEKDTVLRLNPFNATTQIFQRDISFNDRLDAYFVDYDLMPLMVQENYIASITSNKSSVSEKLEHMANAAAYISQSDLIGVHVRQNQRWDLLTNQAGMNVAAAVEAQGFVGRPEFSKWMGKNSSAGKSRRLIQELSIRMRSHSSATHESIRLDYVPYLRRILLEKIKEGETAIPELIEMLDDASISREDFTETLEHFKFSTIERMSYNDLDTKLKTAFTRQYNKASHKSQALVESQYKPKAAKRGAAVKVEDTTGDDDEGFNDNDDEEAKKKQEEEDVSMFMKKGRKKAASSSSKGKGKKRKTSKA